MDKREGIQIMKIAKALWKNEGQGMIECVLILSIISIAAVAIMPSIGDKLVSIFTSTAASF